MSATVASAPARWGSPPLRAPSARAPDGRRRADGSATWVLRRNCSLTPMQLLGVYLSLCAVSLGIATLFWWHGAGVVLVFAGVELSMLGLALLVYARHAGDRETIVIGPSRVRVEHHDGGRVERTEFRAAWLHVEAARGEGSLVELWGDGQRACVGRYLRPELRAALAQELRRALRGAGGDGSRPVTADAAMQSK